MFAPSAMWAQTSSGGTTAAGGLSATDFTLFLEYYDPQPKVWVRMNPTQQQYFFNRARCECAGDLTNYSGYVKIGIQPAAGATQTIQALLTADLGAVMRGLGHKWCQVALGRVGGLGCYRFDEIDAWVVGRTAEGHEQARARDISHGAAAVPWE